MERKKSPNFDLEKQRFTFFQIGLVISLAIILLAFQYSSPKGEIKELTNTIGEVPEDLYIQRTWQEDKPEPKINKIKPKDVFEIIEDDRDLDEEFEIEDTEVDQLTEIISYDFPEEEAVDIIDFFKVEDQPKYPGGMNEFFKFIYSAIEYPEEAIENKIEGTVFIGFVINKKGKLEDVELERGVHNSLDNEAIRVIKLIPDWIPGKQRGKPVSVKFVIPIKFKLN